MLISAKRKLVAGAAGLAVLAGSGGAYAAAAQSPTPAKQPAKPADRAAQQKAFLDDVAKRLNVTREQLEAAVKGAAEARIDAAVAAGKLTKEQGEAAKKRIAAGGGPLFGAGPILRGGPRGGGPGHPGGPGGPGHRGVGLGGDGAAEYLGLTQAQLREQLRAGKSLADIAKATNGKTVEGLKAAIKAKLTARLDAAVKNQKLTQAQRDKIVAEIDQRIDAIVNLTPPDRPARPKLRWR